MSGLYSRKPIHQLEAAVENRRSAGRAPGAIPLFPNSRRVGCLITLFMLVCPRPTMADAWYEDYDRAETLLRQAEAGQDPAQAKEDYLQVIEIVADILLKHHPIPELNKRKYGVAYYRDYLPYYLLGRAYEGLGDWKTALAEYERSLDAAAIRGRKKLYEDLSRRQARLSALLRPSPTPSLLNQANSALKRGDLDLAERLASLLPNPESMAIRAKIERLRQTPLPSATPLASATASIKLPATSKAVRGHLPRPRPTRRPRTTTPKPKPSPTTTPSEAPSVTPRPSAISTPKAPVEIARPPGFTPSSGGNGEPVSPSFFLPWLRAVLIAFPLSLLFGFGGSAILKRRRRRRAVARGFNPYIAGTPILEENMFFGREKLLSQILSTLHHNSLLLHGERRIGKTSLLHGIYRHLKLLDDPEYEFLPVLIDLEGTPEDGFFGLLMSEITSQLDERIAGVDLRFDPTRARGGYAGTDFVRDLRAIVRHLRKTSQRHPKLILLLDEVDVLNTFSNRTNQRLRSLFMKTFARHLGLVMAGVRISKEWDSEGSPWFNFFEEIPVRPLAMAEIRELVVKPVAGIYTYEEEAVQEIVTLAEGRPYIVQKLCIACVSRVAEEKRIKILVEDVVATARHILGNRS